MNKNSNLIDKLKYNSEGLIPAIVAIVPMGRF